MDTDVTGKQNYTANLLMTKHSNDILGLQLSQLGSSCQLIVLTLPVQILNLLPEDQEGKRKTVKTGAGLEYRARVLVI